MMPEEKPSVYLETSFISMLTSRPTAFVTTAGMQQFSILWWEDCRDEFRLFVSDLVYDEISRGDFEAAAKRLRVIEDIPVLEMNETTRLLADEIVRSHGIPRKAIGDAGHVACAAVHEINYIMTWNCRHIANEFRKPLIERLIRKRGFQPPILTTPQLLLGEHYDLDLYLRPE
jgi:predicted nucleic acid-binding protein